MHLGPPFRAPPEPKELSYRMYIMGRNGRSIERSHEFFAADDERAVQIAEAWREGRNIELWQRARLVKEWR